MQKEYIEHTMCTELPSNTFGRNIFGLYKYLWTYVRINLEISAEKRVNLNVMSPLLLPDFEQNWNFNKF
jgi:hypothetical protein